MQFISQLSQNQPLMPQHILVADTDVDSRAVVEGHLHHIFPEVKVTSCDSLKAIKEVLEHEPVDFIITELELKDSSDLQTLAAVTQMEANAPILIHAEKDNAELAIQAVQAGAQDYLLKGRGGAMTFKRIIQHSLERKRLALESQRNEQMLQTFIQYAPAGIAVFDQSFTLLMASDRWCDDHHVSAQEVIGRSFMDIFLEEGKKWKQLHGKCMQGEHIRCEEDEFTTNDGQHHYIRWEMMPWFDIHGGVGGIIQFTDFITEKRQIQQELKDAKENLAQKVEERTQELASAMAMVKQASQAKEEFFTNMTHELRTPLHAIINFSKFGMKKIDRAPQEKIYEYFSDIHRSGERLLGLVNDLLDLTKHQFGKSELQIKPDSLTELISDVAKEMSAIFESKSITLSQQVQPDCEMVDMDRRRMHQVLLNLISNAVKFSSQGDTISLEVTPAESLRQWRHAGTTSPAQMVAFSVIDQGEGIPEDELSAIFDEFAQSRKVYSGEFSGGTGLGLAICRQIVEAHGGSIWAECNPEGGAILRFVIPKTEQGSE